MCQKNVIIHSCPIRLTVAFQEIVQGRETNRSKVGNFSVEQRRNPRFFWTTEVRRLADAIGNTTIAAWEDIFQADALLTPEGLGKYFLSYESFHAVPEGQYIYRKRNIEVSPLDGRPKKLAIAFVAPSATGKDTLLDLILSQFRDSISKVRTHTTRKARDRGEEKSGSYYFTSRKRMETLAQKNRLIEVLNDGANLYGTSMQAFHRTMGSEQPVTVWRGDIIGLPSLKQYCALHGIPFVAVGVLPCLAYVEMEQRIRDKRPSDADARIARARYELEHMADVVDFIALNPPVYHDDGGPRLPIEAAGAIGELLVTLSSRGIFYSDTIAPSSVVYCSSDG